MCSLSLYLTYGSIIVGEGHPTGPRSKGSSLAEQGKVLARNAPSPLQDNLAVTMGKLPETELVMIAESLERIVGLMQMQHVDTAPILETGPTDPVLGDTGA